MHVRVPFWCHTLRQPASCHGRLHFETEVWKMRGGPWWTEANSIKVEHDFDLCSSATVAMGGAIRITLPWGPVQALVFVRNNPKTMGWNRNHEIASCVGWVQNSVNMSQIRAKGSLSFRRLQQANWAFLDWGAHDPGFSNLAWRRHTGGQLFHTHSLMLLNCFVHTLPQRPVTWG